MLIIYKNKGILVLPIWIASVLGTVAVLKMLHENAGSTIPQMDFYNCFGISFLVAGLWTFLIKDDCYKDREGNKKKMDTRNEFFFISMKVWATSSGC